MKKIDLVIALICGLAVAWIASDFFSRYAWAVFFILPVLSVIGLWLVELIGKKFLFAHQAGKFVLVGAFADVVDIKVYQIVILVLPFSITIKAFSFLVATAIKYWANKSWAFSAQGGPASGWQPLKFFGVTLVGLLIDVVAFFYLEKVHIGISTTLWLELSIILAALVTAVWNFLGYKFLVFKK